MRLVLLLALVAAALLLVRSCQLQDRFAFHPDNRPAIMPGFLSADALTLETADGERLAAWHSAAAPGCPTLLYFHGNASRLEGVAPLMVALEARGIGMLAVAFRGYSGSTGRPTERGIRRDGVAAYRYLADTLGVAEAHRAVMGFSLGSTVAVQVAANQPVAALILNAPFESGRRMAGEQVAFLPAGLLVPEAFRTDRYAPSVTAPVLIFHGDRDEIIPPAHSESLATRLAGPVTRILRPGAGHNTPLSRADTSVLADFILKDIPGCAAP